MKTTNDLSATFKALSDETRLRILHLLMEAGELCVCDLEAALGCTQTKISRHMSYLRRAGLTRDRKAGRWVFYTIAASGEKALLLGTVRRLIAGLESAERDIAAHRERVASGCCAALNQHMHQQRRKGRQ